MLPQKKLSLKVNLDLENVDTRTKRKRVGKGNEKIESGTGCASGGSKLRPT